MFSQKDSSRRNNNSTIWWISHECHRRQRRTCGHREKAEYILQ